MRVHDDRYHRERRRFEVALRFIRHEARTHTIRAWTGLTDDRIRKLYRSYIEESPQRAAQRPVPVRHRGKSPRQPAFFTRSARARHESSAFAGLCRLTGALPRASATARSGDIGGPGGDTRDPAGLGRGELLCQAYEIYRARFTTPLLSFEHAEFLLRALCRGDELVLGACRECGAVLVADRWTVRAPLCIVCAGPVRAAVLHSARSPTRRPKRSSAGSSAGSTPRHEPTARHSIAPSMKLPHRPVRS